MTYTHTHMHTVQNAIKQHEALHWPRVGIFVRVVINQV